MIGGEALPVAGKQTTCCGADPARPQCQTAQQYLLLQPLALGLRAGFSLVHTFAHRMCTERADEQWPDKAPSSSSGTMRRAMRR